MCLSIITDNEPVTVGYKVFHSNHGKLLGEFKNTRQVRPVNKWLNEKDYREKLGKRKIKMLLGNTYPTGWYVFHTRRDAQEWAGNYKTRHKTVKKVKIKDPIVVGLQGHSSQRKVTVCKQILILPNNKQ
jgi:hypothetical protein